MACQRLSGLSCETVGFTHQKNFEKMESSNNANVIQALVKNSAWWLNSSHFHFFFLTLTILLTRFERTKVIRFYILTRTCYYKEFTGQQ